VNGLGHSDGEDNGNDPGNDEDDGHDDHDGILAAVRAVGAPKTTMVTAMGGGRDRKKLV
jgi:hypothetical protein